ncbi:MAG TPA: hypothetical protein VHT53_03155 [Candidatus Elarobacter sp.]|nr:hypothetical protein [Candidatus Elarobacter sp.]
MLAVCLAVAAWGYVHLAAAPGTTARFDESIAVPIVVTGLRPGYQANYGVRTATIVVEAPRNGPDLRPDQFRAVLDVSDLTDPGDHNVNLTTVSPGVPIKSISPGSVIVTIDRIEERTFPVAFDYTGDRGGVVVDRAQVDPATTTIRGVATELAKVAAVRVEIPMPARPQQFDEMIRPTATTAQGDPIANVQASPNLVRVRVRFVAAGAHGR